MFRGSTKKLHPKLINTSFFHSPVIKENATRICYTWNNKEWQNKISQPSERKFARYPYLKNYSHVCSQNCGKATKIQSTLPEHRIL